MMAAAVGVSLLLRTVKTQEVLQVSVPWNFMSMNRDEKKTHEACHR
jgi:hypothetical protein